MPRTLLFFLAAAVLSLGALLSQPAAPAEGGARSTEVAATAPPTGPFSAGDGEGGPAWVRRLFGMSAAALAGETQVTRRVGSAGRTCRSFREMEGELQY